jgi:hypothetical protein
MVIVFGMTASSRTYASTFVDELMVAALSVLNSAGITGNFHSVFLRHLHH